MTPRDHVVELCHDLMNKAMQAEAHAAEFDYPSYSTPERVREQALRFYGWTHDLRERVATQVPHIKHWTIHEGDYSQILGVQPTEAATWFVDPPYVQAGRHYSYGSDYVHYPYLAEWCRNLRGQVIVCEQSGADWLPSRDIGAIKANPRSLSLSSREAVWLKEAA